MSVFIYTIVGVYLAAVNFYGFWTVKTFKRAEEDGEECKIKENKLFVASLLGGGLGVYIAMFIFKFRLSSLTLMTFTPVLIAITAFLVAVCFINGFWIAPRAVPNANGENTAYFLSLF